GLGQPVQGQVAGGDLVPGAGDADLGLAPVVVAHADRAQHAAGGSGGVAVGDLPGARLLSGGGSGDGFGCGGGVFLSGCGHTSDSKPTRTTPTGTLTPDFILCDR